MLNTGSWQNHLGGGWTTDDALNLIRDSFAQFGYQPSDAEIQALLPATYRPQDGGVGRTGEAVANYVNAVRQIQNFNANNPLNQVITDEKGFFNDTQKATGVNFDQAVSVMNKAPQLFGSLTPDQIDQYLAPVTQATKESEAQIQTDAARRGAAGSSMEANAIANANQLYKQNVLATGLQVGQNQQQQLANLYGQRASLLQGQLPGIMGNVDQARALLSQQSLQNTQTLSSLLPYLSSYALQEAGTAKNLESLYNPTKIGSSNPWDSVLGQGLGMGAGFLLGGPVGALIGGQFGSGVGSAIGGNSPGGAAQFGAGMNYLPLFMSPSMTGSPGSGGGSYTASPYAYGGSPSSRLFQGGQPLMVGTPYQNS